MKKAVRIYITGSMQSMFFRQFIKENADKNKVKGFFNLREDGRAEIFLEGDLEAVDTVAEIVKKGPKHAVIRKVEEKEEHMQDYKEFKILSL